MRMSNGKNIFERIIDREIPAHIIYEDDHTLAFLSIEPIHKGHTVVIPKRFSRNFLDCSEEDAARTFLAAQKIAKHMKDALGADGINIHVNNEHAAGQEIFHSHLHVIPRYLDKHPFTPPTYETYENNEMETFAEKLKI